MGRIRIYSAIYGCHVVSLCNVNYLGWGWRFGGGSFEVAGDVRMKMSVSFNMHLVPISE